MKKATYLIAGFILLVLCLPSAQAQTKTSTSEYDELYPQKYTFEKAAEFESKGAYDKAIWFYINLFSDNKEKVIAKVKQIKKPDTLSLKKFIEYSFAIYSIFDPKISSMKDGEMQIDYEKLKAKGDIGDYLIACVVNPSDTLLSANQLSLRAKDKCDKYDYQGAIKDYNCAIHLDPQAEYYFYRAFAKSAMGDYSGAMPDYEKCVTLKYKLSETYFERGYAYSILGMYDEAITDYTSTIDLVDTQEMPYNNRAYCYYQLGKYKDAIADYDKAINLDPSYADAYTSRGLAKYKSDDKKGACKDWETAAGMNYQKAKGYKDKYCN
jgi:tetratricopeptide (TPR) repeat protein